MKLLDIVKDQKVHFMFYREGELWYKTGNGFEFPVPVNDKKEVGTAIFMVEDKAILFMRYIRKHLKMIEDARAEHDKKFS